MFGQFFFEILTSHSLQHKMAARGQLQIFLWAQKLQNLKSEIIQIHHDMEMCKWFF